MNAEGLRKFDDLVGRTGEKMRPGTITIAGVDFAAEVKEPELVGDAEEGGELEEGDIVVIVRKAEMAEKPAANTAFTCLGKRWRMRTVTGDEAASARWVIEGERDS